MKSVLDVPSLLVLAVVSPRKVAAQITSIAEARRITWLSVDVAIASTLVGTVAVEYMKYLGWLAPVEFSEGPLKAWAVSGSLRIALTVLSTAIISLLSVFLFRWTMNRFSALREHKLAGESAMALSFAFGAVFTLPVHLIDGVLRTLGKGFQYWFVAAWMIVALVIPSYYFTINTRLSYGKAVLLNVFAAVLCWTPMVLILFSLGVYAAATGRM